MNEPEWIGPASDYLKDAGFEEAGVYLAAAPAKLDLLERIVEAFERRITAALRTNLRELDLIQDPDLHFIAEHRGEKAGETITRLRPPISVHPVAIEEVGRDIKALMELIESDHWVT